MFFFNGWECYIVSFPFQRRWSEIRALDPLHTCCQWMAAAVSGEHDAMKGAFQALLVGRCQQNDSNPGAGDIRGCEWRCHHWVSFATYPAALEFSFWQMEWRSFQKYVKRTRHCREFRYTENFPSYSWKLTRDSNSIPPIYFLDTAINFQEENNTSAVDKAVISTWFSARFFFN